MEIETNYQESDRERRIREAIEELVEDSIRARRDPSFRPPPINAVEDMIKFRKLAARQSRDR